MAIQTISHGLYFPNPPTNWSAAPTTGTGSKIDAAGEKVAQIYEATTSGAIRKVHLRTGTVATGDTVDVRIETLDSSGDPSGTLWATNTNGSLVIDSTDDNVWKTVTLTADASVVAGDAFAIVVVNGSAPGDIIFLNFQDDNSNQQYIDFFLTGAWVKNQTQVLLIPEMDDGTFDPMYGYVLGSAVTNNVYNSSSTTNRRGNIFTLPVPARCSGCWGWVDGDNDWTIKLYDSDGSTVLGTTSTQTSVRRMSVSASLFFMPWTGGPVTLSKATSYRVAYVPDTASNITTYGITDLPSDNMMAMFPGGTAVYRSLFTSSAWVESTGHREWIGLILDGFDDGVGGGGGGGPLIGGRLVR